MRVHDVAHFDKSKSTLRQLSSCFHQDTQTFHMLSELSKSKELDIETCMGLTVNKSMNHGTRNKPRDLQESSAFDTSMFN